MTQQLDISNDGEVVQPPLHDARVRGLLLCASNRLVVPVETSGGVRLCLVFYGVERLRADDFRQGNIILDVVVSKGADIDMADVAYAYGLKQTDQVFLEKTM